MLNFDDYVYSVDVNDYVKRETPKDNAMIDPQTGCDDDYDEALQFCINEIIEEIHRIKELDNLAVESVYYSMFGKEIEQRYQEYLQELQV